MKHLFAFSLILLSNLSFANDEMVNQNPGAPVQYVRVCDVVGKGYFYIPETATCLNPVTGVTKKQTGTVDGKPVFNTGESELAYRVARLEQMLGIPKE